MTGPEPQDEPHRLEYADPELPRSGLPPDGYLGYRSDEPPEGIKVGCVGWLIILSATLLLLWGLLWMLARHLSSYGI